MAVGGLICLMEHKLNRTLQDKVLTMTSAQVKVENSDSSSQEAALSPLSQIQPAWISGLRFHRRWETQHMMSSTSGPPLTPPQAVPSWVAQDPVYTHTSTQGPWELWSLDAHVSDLLKSTELLSAWLELQSWGPHWHKSGAKAQK